MSAGGTIWTLLDVATCRSQSPCLPSSATTYTTYRPSPEIAARPAVPVVVSRVSVTASNAPFVSPVAAGPAPRERIVAQAPRPITATAPTAAMIATGLNRGRLTVTGRATPLSACTAPESRSVLSDRRSLRRSLAVWYRSSGSFARQRPTMRPMSRGNSRLRSVSNRGVSLMIDDISDTCVSPLNGRSPTAISYRITPSEKTSLRGSTNLPSACSGDM